ncbi:MAG: excinuclease ABC subunit UvrB [Patescibacteria group bacterium]
MSFQLISQFTPQGDQPQAIAKLVDGVEKNFKNQVLLGITGSGKTFTMASVIKKLKMPALVISPNKTLAAQLYQEFKSFFPNNAIQYFVSYYDYYQPEAYLPLSNTYIQKEARVNAEIDKLRHATIQSVLTRKDTLVVASVSCIYGIGDPDLYKNVRLELRAGQVISSQDLIRHLNLLQYQRNDNEPGLGEFSVTNTAKGSRIFIHLVTDEKINIEIKKRKITSSASIYPAKFWVAPQHKFNLSLQNIKSEMEQRIEELQSANKFEEAERLEKKTLFDLAMLKKNKYVNGIENYSRHLNFRTPGDPPLTLLDYFPKPFLLFIDESHISVPQLNAMQESDRRRKQVLVDYGFRLPSALDNRPLTFVEFNQKIGQTIFVSATPSRYELERAKQNGQIAEQLVRPTGILDPKIKIRSAQNQVHDLLKEIKIRIDKNERVLALTLTKRASEDLTEFLLKRGIKANYLHSEIKTLKRTEVLSSLRRGEIDVIVGINLLREGLDLPEVSLVAILDADREGFLRNYRSLIQMAGRAARSINGEVILYADFITESIRKTANETLRRRKIQEKFNKNFGITPKTIQKEISIELIKTEKK